MPTCGVITAGVLVNCNDPLVAGAKDRLILINKDDIDSYTVDGSNPLLITNITLASGKVGFVFEGYKFSNEPTSSVVLKDFATPKHKHTVVFRVFDKSPATKKQLDLLEKGTYVAVVENNYKGTNGNAAFEIYGKENGLWIESSERNIIDDATQGAPVITLASSDKALEPHAPATWFDTNYATTKAKADGLLS